MLWWLAQNALGATVLAGAVALLTRFVRVRPAVAHVLWLLVILKLLAPPLLVWPWPGDPLEPATRIAETSSDVPRLVLRNTSNAPTEATPSSISAKTFPVTSPYELWLTWAQTAVSKDTLKNLLTHAWLIGALAMAVLQLAWLVRLRLGLRKGVAPPSWLLDELQRLAELLEVPSPRTVVLATGSPLLVGGIRPTLVLPASLFDRLDTHGWKSVLAHELSHLKRRDHWTGWLELAAACLWWWNPVFWYARRRLRESAEYACDAWVVRLLPQNRRAYAESLITVAASLTRHPLPMASIGMAAHGRRIFERRLEMILREAVPHRMSRLAITGAALAALLMLPGWALPTTTKPSPSPLRLAELQNVTVGSQTVVAQPAAPAEAQIESATVSPELKGVNLDQRVAIEFENQHVSDVLSFLCELCGVNFVLDSRVVAPAPSSPKIAPDGAIGAPAPSPETAATDQSNAYVTDGIVRHINLSDVPLKVALSALLKPLHLDFKVAGNIIFISTAKNLAKEDFEVPPLEPGQKAIPKEPNVAAQAIPAQPTAPGSPEYKGTNLDQPVSIEFENQHVSDVLDFLYELRGVNFIVDSRVVAPPRSFRADGTEVMPETAAADKTPAYVTDGIVRYLRLQDVPLSVALTALLRPLLLDYAVAGHAIFISTPENLEMAQPEAPSLEPSQEAMAKKLSTNVATEFETQNLHGLLDYVRAYFGVDCRVDPEARLPGTSQPAEQGIVYYMRLEDVPLWEALYWMTLPLDLTYAVKGDTVWITTPDRMTKLPPSPRPVDLQKTPDGAPAAQIRYDDNSAQWYKEGEKLEDYTVKAIDLDKKEVTLQWDKDAVDKVTVQLNLEPGGPST